MLRRTTARSVLLLLLQLPLLLLLHQTDLASRNSSYHYESTVRKDSFDGRPRLVPHLKAVPGGHETL